MKSTRYLVQYEASSGWCTVAPSSCVGSHPLLIDATIALGKECGRNPHLNHRILRLEEEPVFIVDKIIVEE